MRPARKGSKRLQLSSVFKVAGMTLSFLCDSSGAGQARGGVIRTDSNYIEITYVFIYFSVRYVM